MQKKGGGGVQKPSGWKGKGGLVAYRTEVDDWPRRAIHHIDSATLVSG